MKRLFLKLAVSLMSLSSLSAYAFVSGQWNYGWGQGISEYVAYINDNNQLYMACDNYQENPVTIILTVNGRDYGELTPDGSKDFDLIIDGEKIESFNETRSRVGHDNFMYAWDKLRQAHSIVAVTTDGQRLVLPAKGSAKVLPKTSSSEFGCKTAW